MIVEVSRTLHPSCRSVEHFSAENHDGIQWDVTNTGRAWRCWGLRRCCPLLDLQVRVPALEHGTQFTVERFDARLQQQMGAAFRPLHLLAFAKPFAYHLIYRGLHEPRGNGFFGENAKLWNMFHNFSYGTYGIM
jgi:hypothetical protein